MTFSPGVFRGRLICRMERAAAGHAIRDARCGARRAAQHCKVFWNADRVSDFLRRRLGPQAA